MHTIRFNVDDVQRRALLKGLSERELLKRAGLSQNIIAVARHKNTMPRPSSIAKLAAVLECEPADLIIILSDDEEVKDHAED